MTETNTKDTGPDLEGLEEFVSNPDRGKAAHFAGREAEIAAIEDLAPKARGGLDSLTHVITAAPGAGKTALLRELEARWRENGMARPVYMRADSFSSPAVVVEKMLAAMDPEAAERFGVVETETEAQYAEGGVNAGLSAKTGRHSSHSMQRTTLPVTFSAAFRELKDRETPVVLLVDEAQRWGTDQDAGNRRGSSLLSEAHLNPEQLPLLIVAAGLGDAPRVVTERGASRLKTEKGPLILEGLSDQEMREVCSKFFDRYRIAGNDEQREEWIRALIRETDGWPRHLTNALRGAAEALIAGQGDLSQSALRQAREGADAYRRQFYHEQTEPFQRSPELLAAVFGAMTQEDGATAYALRKAITQAYEDNPDLADEMPKRDVFTKLLHHGLIQDFGYNRYNCPIPSLRRCVEKLCAEEGHPPPGCKLAPDGPAAPFPEPSGGMDMEA